MHLAEHIEMAFSPWVALLGEYTPDVLRPFCPGTLTRHDEKAMENFGRDICGNKIAHGLPSEGSHKDSTLGGCLTFSEIVIRVKQDTSYSWKQAPVHD
ncbi:hypothetical protein TNCV_3230091 [Trichonephila clavipes]|nr:hypothetical protein TNCV_3230091 [Trichonephila clavipes]